MQFWVPKGNNRFHFTGGARFVHGGAMLQEIVVPVIQVKHLKDKGRREKTRSQLCHRASAGNGTQDHDPPAPFQPVADGAGEREG